MKLVAVVLDYGTAADAPKGEKPPHGVVAACVEIPKNGNGFDVLREADVTVRQDGGLICGLNGYPRTECAPAVTATPTPTAKPADADADQALIRTLACQVALLGPAGSFTEFLRRSNTFGDARQPAVPRPTSPRSPRPAARPRPPPTAASESSAPTSGSASALAEAAPSLVVGDVAADPDGGGSPWALIVGGAVLVLILGAAGLRARWNR